MDFLRSQAASLAVQTVRENVCKVGNFIDKIPVIYDPLDQKRFRDRFWNAICPVEAPPELELPPGFEGGQCEDIRYRVVIERVDGETPGQVVTLFSWGPIAPLRVVTAENAAPSYLFDRRNSEGGETSPIAVNDQRGDPPGTAFIRSVEPEGGGPDVCGNPIVGPTPPPEGDPEPIPIVEPDPEDPDGPGNTFIFAPKIGPIKFTGIGEAYIITEFNITGPTLIAPVIVDVKVDLPDFEPTIVITGGGAGDGDGVGEPITTCCEPEVREPDGSPPLDPEIDEDDEPGPIQPIDSSRLIGAVVRSTIIRESIRSTIVAQGRPELTLYLPRLANAYFKVEVGERLSWVGPVPVQLENQFMAAPLLGRAVEVVVVPETGVSCQVTEQYVFTNR